MAADHSSSRWYLACTKLRFYSRIRRFLRIKVSKKQRLPSDLYEPSRITDSIEKDKKEVAAAGRLQMAVKSLHFGSWEEKEAAAREIQRLAAGEYLTVPRRLMAEELGVVPPLVDMAGSEVVQRRRVAVQALAQLAKGSYKNKVLILEADILSKGPENVTILDETTIYEYAELIFSLLSVANLQLSLDATKIVTFLVAVLNSKLSDRTEDICLSILCNLSTKLDYASNLVSYGAIEVILELSRTKRTSEKALVALGNLSVTLVGKHALESNPTVPGVFIEILTWENEPKCQEFALYVLMILANRSSIQRRKMTELEIVPRLLEVALLGSTLAQKRAMKLLQWFKDERQARICPHSGPQARMNVFGSPVSPRMVDEGRRLMRKMVKESLDKNMETITRRASGVDQNTNSSLKMLVLSSSSKSLPY
ncbi:uncharacterized protein LOC124932113 [Impatiens glandulifera]|uniref:uncharacterized protein LOC124932113 n=1 Tax=Impatiens glandulifera TaxID=253017 RepID=UPI001FB1143D|nr:uncharacterized protein LOC124932113 [Impatiens glandulifera]